MRITKRAVSILLALGLHAENHGCFDRSRLLPRHRHSESGPAVGLAYGQVESSLPQVFLFSFIYVSQFCSGRLPPHPSLYLSGFVG
jgi:hypothetical protein